MGPLLGHKDFEINSTWYEVKSISEGAIQVNISSLEQLEAEVDGHLVLVRLEETSEKNDMAINLNRLVLQIVDMIDDPELLDTFRLKLDNAGYVTDPEYDKICFTMKGVEPYRVDDKFPRIRRKNLDSAIGNASYTIMTSGIVGYLEKNSES